MTEETIQTPTESTDRPTGATPVAQFSQSAPETATPAASASESSWLYADGIPGEGEKPEWFNDKTFKTVTDQAKAQSELRKALGERTGSPENYEVPNLGEDYKDFQFNKEDPLFKFWDKFGKEAKLPQDMFNTGLKAYADYIKGLESERGEAFKKSIESLGAGSDQVFDQLKNWFGNNFPDHSFDNFKMLLQTPEDVKMVMAMKEKMQSSAISTQDIKPTQALDRDYWRNQMSKENGYGVDMAKTTNIQAAFKEFHEKGGKI